MTEVLLTSEAFVKNVTGISDNIYAKYLLPSIREAQETGLRSVLGDALTDRLKDIVRGTIAPDIYRELIDKLQYYLAYSTVVQLIPKVHFKVVNMGVVTTSDDSVQPVSYSEVEKMSFYYQSKADAECRKVQQWLLHNHAAFPELTENDCHAIKANLSSAASCGLWLGGARGRRRRV